MATSVEARIAPGARPAVPAEAVLAIGCLLHGRAIRTMIVE